MHITLSPIRSDAGLTLHRAGDVLTINGEALDLSVIPEGATLPAEAVACDWIAGPITRTAGGLHLTLLLPHGAIPDPAPPEALAVTHPAPITLTGDGPVLLPSWAPPEPPAITEATE
ncbi:hypothetical protein [Gemmobacter sp.]|uniref:hypothetical protein n=1 Tax=Gemmobacter sp. TaxID=1898957 RepID=UPI002AFF77A0|nr:hypothetical protein [Gemmobacter sp.]